MLIEEKNPETIRSILEMVQKNISEGKIMLKDKEKIMVEIKRILDNNLFENFLKEYLLLTEELEKLGEDINAHEASSIKNKMENQIEDVERDIETTKLEMEKVKKQTEKMKNSIKERKITMGKTLTLLAKREISINV
jgi:aminoglycoside phosphotransferase family enzyme